MPHPCPHHCPPERGGPVVLVVLAVIAAAVLARPVVHAAATVLEVAAVVVGVVLGLAAVAAVVVLAARTRRHARELSYKRVVPRVAASRPAETLSEPQTRAIEARKPGAASDPASGAAPGVPADLRRDGRSHGSHT